MSQAFWEVVEHHLDEVQKRQLLLFWSGSSTAPALGFESDPEEDWQWTLAKLTGTSTSQAWKREMRQIGHAAPVI